MFKCHVNKWGVSVKPLPGSRPDQRMWVSSGCRDEGTLIRVPGGLSVGVNTHMKNMIQLE